MKKIAKRVNGASGAREARGVNGVAARGEASGAREARGVNGVAARGEASGVREVRGVNGVAARGEASGAREVRGVNGVAARGEASGARAARGKARAAEKWVRVRARDWERIWELAIGAVDWDDTDGTVSEELAARRARKCCEEVMRVNERVR